MPVEFLTEEHKNQYGRFNKEPNESQLARYFHLDDTDLTLINKHRGDYNKLGFALQLTTVRFLGTFLPDPIQIPSTVIEFVSNQLHINAETLHQYMERKVTRYAHSNEIQSHYGYHEFNIPPWRFRLTRLLFVRAWISNERPTLMFDFATAWLIRNKVLLPGASTLSRLISEIRERASNRLWSLLSDLPDDNQKAELERLLSVPENSNQSRFEYFRKGPVRVSGPAFNTAIERYKELSEFGFDKLDVSHIPSVRLKSLARNASVISMVKIARMPEKKRIAILVAFVKSYEVIALDDALEVLDLLITSITSQAKRLGQKNRLRTLKDLDKSALILADVCHLLLSEGDHQSDLHGAVLEMYSRDKLAQSIETINNIARPSNEKFHREMVEQYGRIRRFLPHLLAHIEFKSTPAGESIIKALEFLSTIEKSHKIVLDNAPIEIITNSWKNLVFDKDGRVNKRGYTLCAMERLQDSLRRRDVYVENCNRWGDPRAKLIQGPEWQSSRIQVCRALGHSIASNEVLKKLSKQLDDTYRQVAANFDDNHLVNVDSSSKHPTLTITNLEKIDEPTSLTLLSDRVASFLPDVDLTELILEIHTHTGFADAFTHISESHARADDLTTSICAVLLAEACNIGLEPLIKHNIPALTKGRLSWIKQNYIRAETLIKANALLVDYQASLPLAKNWGGGEVASADGMRFVTPVQTLNARPNKKYFGSGKGITWYNFMSNQFSGFHGIVIPGTLRDSMFVLEGLLEQQTGLNPTEIMTDTTGTSDMVFGLFWLLGYQFSPRLADAGEAVFWRIDKEAHYGALNEIACGYAKPEKIEQHWDEMLRIAGSLKLGKIRASELIRSLLKSNRPSGVAQAIIEAGRINKTIYLLNYIDNEDYRRRILTQLNRGEGRHAVARAICHGQLGEIRKRYREGQEDQLGALGLVTNAVVLWNTIYMDEALKQMENQAIKISEEDKARLSPLLHNHINVLGHYSFTLSEQVTKGHLRPLNDPSDKPL